MRHDTGHDGDHERGMREALPLGSELLRAGVGIVGLEGGCEHLAKAAAPDLPTDQRSGLIAVSDILSDVQDISFVRFGGEDVVRHKLVQRIVAAYGEHAERRSPASGR